MRKDQPFTDLLSDAPGKAPAGEPESPGWLVGQETDPITDDTSVIVRQRVEPTHRDANGVLLLVPSLTVT